MHATHRPTYFPKFSGLFASRPTQRTALASESQIVPHAGMSGPLTSPMLQLLDPAFQAELQLKPSKRRPSVAEEDAAQAMATFSLSAPTLRGIRSSPRSVSFAEQQGASAGALSATGVRSLVPSLLNPFHTSAPASIAAGSQSARVHRGPASSPSVEIHLRDPPPTFDDAPDGWGSGDDYENAAMLDDHPPLARHVARGPSAHSTRRPPSTPAATARSPSKNAGPSRLVGGTAFHSRPLSARDAVRGGMPPVEDTRRGGGAQPLQGHVELRPPQMTLQQASTSDAPCCHKQHSHPSREVRPAPRPRGASSSITFGEARPAPRPRGASSSITFGSEPTQGDMLMQAKARQQAQRRPPSPGGPPPRRDASPAQMQQMEQPVVGLVDSPAAAYTPPSTISATISAGGVFEAGAVTGCSHSSHGNPALCATWPKTHGAERAREHVILLAPGEIRSDEGVALTPRKQRSPPWLIAACKVLMDSCCFFCCTCCLLLCYSLFMTGLPALISMAFQSATNGREDGAAGDAAGAAFSWALASAPPPSPMPRSHWG